MDFGFLVKIQVYVRDLGGTAYLCVANVCLLSRGVINQQYNHLTCNRFFYLMFVNEFSYETLQPNRYWNFYWFLWFTHPVVVFIIIFFLFFWLNGLRMKVYFLLILLFNWFTCVFSTELFVIYGSDSMGLGNAGGCNEAFLHNRIYKFQVQPI